MDFQLILVFALFGVAVIFLLKTVFRSIKPGKKDGACKSCSACSDFSAVENPVKKP